MADTMTRDCVKCGEETDCLSFEEGWVCMECKEREYDKERKNMFYKYTRKEILEMMMLGSITSLELVDLLLEKKPNNTAKFHCTFCGYPKKGNGCSQCQPDNFPTRHSTTELSGIFNSKPSEEKCKTCLCPGHYPGFKGNYACTCSPRCTNNCSIAKPSTEEKCSICKGTLKVKDMDGELTDFDCVCVVAREYEPVQECEPYEPNCAKRESLCGGNKCIKQCGKPKEKSNLTKNVNYRTGFFEKVPAGWGIVGEKINAILMYLLEMEKKNN